MAEFTFNRYVDRVRGKSGKVVFKTVLGHQIDAALPTPSGKPPTPAQVRVHERFKTAAQYAQRTLQDAQARGPYVVAAKARNTTAFGLAVRDHMLLPRVKEIDLAEYLGRVGDPINVLAEDDFEVVSVKVTIRDPAGATLEEGLAAQNLEGRWVYRATTVAPANQLLAISASAKDRPGRDQELTEQWQKP